MHEVLPDRLVMYVNQAHNIYIKTIPAIKHKCYWEKLRIQYLVFQDNTCKNQDFFITFSAPMSNFRTFQDQWKPCN